MPEVQQGKEMMSYAKKNPSSFVNHAWYYPFMVGLFKVLGGLFASITNAFIIMQSPDSCEAVKDFVAVGIIYEIDNIVAKTLFGSETKEMLEVDKKKIVVTKEADQRTDIDVIRKFKPVFGDEQEDRESLSLGSFILLTIAMFIYRVFALFYQIIYFYFIPMLVCLIYF